MAFALPIKGDIDRILSDLMHAARHKLMAEVPRVMAQASQAGALQGDRVIVTLPAIADQSTRPMKTVLFDGEISRSM